jgi:hypothetical protein
MADVKISALPAGAPAAGTDLTAIARGGGNNSLSVADILTADVHATFSEDTGQAAEVAAPTSAVRIYALPLGGRYGMRFIGPSGLPTDVQLAFFANNVTIWLPGTGAAAAINWGISFTVVGQTSPNIANTNFMTQMRRAVFTTTTTAANASGVRGATACCWRGNSAGLGGFFFAARGGILTYTSTMRIIFGLSASGAALSADPSTIANTLGFTKDTGETVWQALSVSGAPVATKVSSGRTTQAAGTSDIFDFFMFAKPNGANVTYSMYDITTATALLANSVISTNLPNAAGLFFPYAYCQNVAGGAGSLVEIFLNKIYVESDT